LNRPTEDGDVTTLQQVELGVLGPLQVRQYGLPVSVPGAKPRAILTMLGLHAGSVVSADVLVELLWGDDPPRTVGKALQTHVSSLRHALGDGFVLTEGAGWTLGTAEIDASRFKAAARTGREAAAAGDANQAVARFEEALGLWRGVPELPDGSRGMSERTRWIETHAALVEDRADALLATGRAAEIIGELEAAIADAPLRERRWGQLMLALYRAGRQGEALNAYQRVRSLLADQLGVDPGPDLRRLEAAIVAQDSTLEIPVPQQLSSVTRAVTFLLTDIEGSTAAWEADADAMAVALARHDEIVEQVVTSHGGRLVKTRGEGDATFSVFDRPSAAATAAIDLQETILHEPWGLREPMRIRVALHTGEVELRDGDYFGRAVNRAARLRSLAAGGQILCSGATAELVIDSLSDDVLLVDLGTRQLRNLTRPEHVFELRLDTAEGAGTSTPDAPIERPDLPTVLTSGGPFVGRSRELERLLSAWQTTLAAGTHAVLIAGEPGVGKTRLAGEWSRHVYEQGAVVLYGRCDEDLGAPYQPFAEALRTLVPCVAATQLRGLRGVEALLPLVPALAEALPDLAAPTRADPETERYALFDAVVALLGASSSGTPIVLILDDLHWATKPTLLLLRHLLRFGEHARVQIVGTYRSTDLDRSHPLAAMLADLHRDGSADRIQLSGLDEDDVTAYVAEAGYDDEELGRALASVTGGNPFFLIEALRHVQESGGSWDPNTLPQGVREAVSRRLSRLPAEANKALAAAAVIGSRFALDLVERVLEQDLVDAFDEARKAGIVIEEPGGRYRFNHALVRQSLLAELASVRRMRLHQRIAATLEAEPGADDELLAELAYHYFECAWAGNAAKAVEYCRRAADQAITRLAYEGAADLYDKALHALEELDDELPDRDQKQAELLLARCEALLAAGDVSSARIAVSQLQDAAGDSARLAAWGICFDGQLSMLISPERLDEIETAVAVAADKLAELQDAAGEANAHTVRAACLARLGRIADCESALDQALTAARTAQEHRRVNAVLAGAPLAALWGPNPVPRAGGRCLDVVRLLRITTGSPVVEATSTRCQGVLDAFRGRAAAGRQLIDSARRSLTDLGMRHALLEVDQFAGIVEWVDDEPAAAEPYLRRAYNGFRRMGLDSDTADTAALLARACLALGRDDEADELCSESERLAGHALKPAIAWRTVRAQLLARAGAHEEARRVAEEAVSIAERTDILVDHGDACLALATVLTSAGDVAGARAAAERALGLYEAKGAAALAEKARILLGDTRVTASPMPAETPIVELDNTCVRVLRRLDAAYDRQAWDEVEQYVATVITCESRRKVVGMGRIDLPYSEWAIEAEHYRETLVPVRYRHEVVTVRGEQLALTSLEVGPTDQSPGAPRDELLEIYGLDDDGRISLQLWFDVDDMDAAIAELDAEYVRREARQRRIPLENAATRAEDLEYTLITEGRPDDVAALLADDHFNEDRRHGLRCDTNNRAAAMKNIRAMAALGANITSTHLALRGDRLCLSRVRFEERAKRSAAFCVDTLELTEVGANGVMTARVVFDVDDFEAAIAELDARYLVGEAAPYARPWSVIARSYRAVSRREPPAVTSDLVSIDHRRSAAFEAGGLMAYIGGGRELDMQAGPYIEKVHRLTELGAVVSYTSKAASPDGFEAEWREVTLSTVQGDLINRCELFDETELDSALATFDELSRPAPQLENAASHTFERTMACLATRDWDAMAETMAEDYSVDDRRRTVNAGIRHGRDAELEDARASADVVGITDGTSVIKAIRGERVALAQTCYRAGRQPPEVSEYEVLQVIETDASERMTALVVFDLDNVDEAFAELDARYLAGEAGPHASTWSVIMNGYATLNRHEIPALTPDWVNIDHRRATSFAQGDQVAFIRASWQDTPDIRMDVTAVHRLTAAGAVVSATARGTSQDGFAAEWPSVQLVMIERDAFSRCELFDETDLDTALAKFDELSRPAQQRLENTASRAYESFSAHFTARDWDAITDSLADDVSSDDRRRVVNAGLRHGRDAVIDDLRIGDDMGVTHMTPTIIATRGERLALSSTSYWGPDRGPTTFVINIFHVIEVDADNRIATSVLFDLDDMDSAFAELDARYLTGEASAHAHSWSVIAKSYSAFNRREPLAPLPDWVDHRRVVTIEADGLAEINNGASDVTPDVKLYVESVHRLSDLGAAVTYIARGTTPDGFRAEWREVALSVVNGEAVSRCEIFEDADIAAALARFDELDRPSRPENAASRVAERCLMSFAARDWAAMAQTVAADVSVEDRRRVVNGGVRRGRDAFVDDFRAAAETGFEMVDWSVVATRGEHLLLTRGCYSGLQPQAFRSDVLQIGEINAENELAAVIVFDLDDIDDAFAELDCRFSAGEAAHSHVWSVVARAYAALNRHEQFDRDWVFRDHRRGTPFAPKVSAASAHPAVWDVTPEFHAYIEVVHRLSEVAMLVTLSTRGSSAEGFEAEWRMIQLLTVHGDSIDRCELFDEDDIDAALARFDELSRAAPRLDNAATRRWAHVVEAFNRRDLDALLTMTTASGRVIDRRKGLGAVHEGAARVEAARALFVVPDSWRTDIRPLAVRGSRLALIRQAYRDTDEASQPIAVELLTVAEVDDGLIGDVVNFDVDDFEAALEELDARYIAGEAAEHAHTWSVIAAAYTALNRQELPPTTPDWINVDRRTLAMIEPGDLTASIRAGWDLARESGIYIETAHRLSHLGAAVTWAAHGISLDSFEIEERGLSILTVEGDLINRCELFDEGDLDAAIARFDELSRAAPRLENAALRSWRNVVDAINRQDLDGFLALAEAGAHWDDRRKVLRSEGTARPEAVRAVFEMSREWELESEPVAIRGTRFGLTRDTYRDTTHPARPITLACLILLEVGDDGRGRFLALFDPDDIDGAFDELDARWIASGDVAHPEIIETAGRANQAYNRHDWEAVAAREAGATYVNDRQLISGETETITDHWSSIRALASLIPDMWVEAAEILTHSATGLVSNLVVKGTTTKGAAIELPAITLILFDKGRVTRLEAFDVGQRDLALARFAELSSPR
jgi:class 3 adenylate cyclase